MYVYGSFPVALRFVLTGSRGGDTWGRHYRFVPGGFWDAQNKVRVMIYLLILAEDTGVHPSVGGEVFKR